MVLVVHPMIIVDLLREPTNIYIYSHRCPGKIKIFFSKSNLWIPYIGLIWIPVHGLKTPRFWASYRSRFWRWPTCSCGKATGLPFRKLKKKTDGGAFPHFISFRNPVHIGSDPSVKSRVCKKIHLILRKASLHIKWPWTVAGKLCNRFRWWKIIPNLLARMTPKSSINMSFESCSY
jgi:hypothetical protein